MDLPPTPEELICLVCDEMFGSKEKCPRMLPCGHTFCGSCLKKVIHFIKYCPTCEQKFKAARCEEIPINFVAKKLASSIRRLPNKNTEYCLLHYSLIYFKCMDCTKYVCGTCIQFSHKNCKNILTLSELMELAKKFQLLKIDKVKSKLSTEKKRLHELKEDFKEEGKGFNYPWLKVEFTSYFTEDFDTVLNKLHEMEDSIKNASIQDLDSAVVKVRQYLQKLNLNDDSVSLILFSIMLLNKYFYIVHNLMLEVA